MLDQDDLTKHLLELAQRVGVEKVTMRGLAAQAGTSASSVYYHVAGKAELLDLLIEAVVNSIEIPAEGEWQQRVVTLYTNAWRVLVTVRGIAGLLQQRQTRPPLPTWTGHARHPARIRIVHASFHRRVRLLYVHLLGSVELEHNRPARATRGRPGRSDVSRRTADHSHRASPRRRKMKENHA